MTFITAVCDFCDVLQRVHLDIQVGEHANNYAEIAAKDKLTELQLRVRQLVEQVDQIQKEQNYQRVSQKHSLLHFFCVCQKHMKTLNVNQSRSSLRLFDIMYTPKTISLTEHFHHFTCCQHQFPDNMKACTLHQTPFMKTAVLPPDVLLFLPQLVI